MFILLFIPILLATSPSPCFSKPVEIGIEKNLSSTVQLSSNTKCYFSEIRKTALETKDRPGISLVSMTCSGELLRMGDLLNQTLPHEIKNEHPLALLICRGSGQCDLNFNNSSVLDEWKSVKICKHHSNELLSQWKSVAIFRDMHIHRLKASQGHVEACSMPESLGPKHEKGRPVGNFHLSVKGSDAILKNENILIHPGIPLCRNHENYVKDLIAKPHSPPNKKQKISTSSSDSDSCSDDSSDEELKKENNDGQGTSLAHSFAQFAKLAGETRVCAKKPFSQLKPITQEKKARTARKLFLTMIGIMVPNGTEEFKSMVQRKTFMTEKWTTGSTKSLDALMIQISDQFFASENRRTKLLILSLVANSVSYLEVVRYIPYLSRYMYQSAKKFGRRKRTELAFEQKKLERYNHEAVRQFISFLTSPTVMIGLPYGVRTIRKTDGSRIEIPNSIRQQSSSEIIEMWTKICKDSNRTDILLSVSTMYKILQICAATKRESTSCVDYYIANGMEAMEKMHEIIDSWISEEMFAQSLKQLKTELLETAQYFRTDFRLHIKSHSRVPDHCSTFALSDPNDKKLSSSCSAGPDKHAHDLRCDRCERANTMLHRVREYAEEFVEEVKAILNSAHGVLKKNTESLLKRRQDELVIIKKSIDYVIQMKKHLLRSAYTNQEREKILSELKDNEALVTLDFAQKYNPKFHREKQNQYFGKKGISYHLSHVTANIGGVLAQHSFLHIFSGSVTQDGTLVVLTVAHFLKELEKVGIKKITLRSDNAGAYHSAPTIGSLHWLNETTGVLIDAWTFSEAQNGKSSSDRDANRVKNKARNFVDKGNDISNSDQFFKAMQENPINGISVYHGSVTPDADSGKTQWPGISSLNHFSLEKNGVRGRKYGKIGDGIFVEKTTLKPIKGKFNFDEKSGHLASNIISIEDERKAVLSGAEPKFWYHPRCAKSSKCEKEPDNVTDEIEEDVTDTDVGLYSCPEPGCSATFLKMLNLEKHVLKSRHKIAPERMTERDYAINLFRRGLEEVNESKTFPTLEAALKELKETKENTNIKKGWGLPEKRKRIPFPEDTKQFLLECFNEGITSRNPLNPLTVQRRMRNAKNEKGENRFSLEEILDVPQIASYMNRETQKRKSGHAKPTSNCTRKRRSHHRSSRHRRSQTDCKTDDEHTESGLHEFVKTEEYWTTEEEFYHAVLEKYDDIFEREPEAMEVS